MDINCLIIENYSQAGYIPIYKYVYVLSSHNNNNIIYALLIWNGKKFKYTKQKCCSNSYQFKNLTAVLI